MLSVGSLFSGVGGFDLGLERAGMRVLWQCESDPFCQRVLARHWPGVPCYPDVSELRGADVAPVDVLCGGFPCQDISLAGKGAGIDGSRSGLWSEYARLIGEFRPRYVVVENVSALLARGMGRVLADLAALGYDAEWDCIPASAVGAPHRRDRLWLVAYPIGYGVRIEPRGCSGTGGAGAPEPRNDGQEGIVADAERVGRDGRPKRDGSGGAGACGGSGPRVATDADATERSQGGAVPRDRREDVADAPCDGRGSRRQGRSAPGGAREPEQPLQDADERALQSWRVGGRIAQAGGSEWWAAEPPVGRVAHGVPNRLDQLAALGNALVPQIAEWIGQRILEWEAIR